MALDPRQLLLLAIAFGVPVIAFLMGRSRLVLAWVGFTLFVQIFDTTILTNLPAGRVVGLLFLPAAIASFRHWSRLLPARAWLINFLYMVALGCLFGFIHPWPDISGTRPFTLAAQGRTIIYLTRTLSDLSLTVFVMDQLARPGAFETLRKWMVRGAVVSSLAAFATAVTKFDFYTFITGLRSYAALAERPRGLAFEPRGLGLACVYGVILILGKETRRPREYVWLLILAAGLGLSASTSALAAAIAGLVVVAIIGSMRVRLALMAAAVVVLILAVAIAAIFPEVVVRSREEVAVRLKGRGVAESNNVTSPAEAIAMKMDVFDSAASLFLIRNPKYALIGTGPGLISLPASEHIPDGLYRIIFPIINSPPQHGILLELANTGVIGVLLWGFQVLVIFVAGRRLRGRKGLPFPPKAATTMFVAAAALYAVQTSPSPFWAVFLGLGWAIMQAQLARERVEVRRPHRTSEASALSVELNPPVNALTTRRSSSTARGTDLPHGAS